MTKPKKHEIQTNTHWGAVLKKHRHCNVQTILENLDPTVTEGTPGERLTTIAAKLDIDLNKAT